MNHRAQHAPKNPTHYRLSSTYSQMHVSTINLAVLARWVYNYSNKKIDRFLVCCPFVVRYINLSCTIACHRCTTLSRPSFRKLILARQHILAIIERNIFLRLSHTHTISWIFYRTRNIKESIAKIGSRNWYRQTREYRLRSRRKTILKFLSKEDHQHVWQEERRAPLSSSRIESYRGHDGNAPASEA